MRILDRMHPFVRAADELRDAARNRLASYVEYETPTGDADALNRFTEVLAERYATLGGSVSRRERATGDHLVVSWDGAAAADGWLLVLAHHDTVWPVGQLAEAMPYGDDGQRISGPGVFDMKGGLVVFETALEVLAATATPLARPIRLIVVADEEIGSPTARPVVEELLPGAVAAVGLEPPHPRGRLKTSRHGSTRIRLSVTGREAHAALDPGRGVSAIDELVDQLLRIRELAAAEPSVLCNVGTIGGGGRTNVTAGEAYADLGFRFADADSEQRVLAALAKLPAVRPEAELSVRTLTSRPAWTPGGNDAFLERVRSAGALVGQEVDGAPALGAADTNIAGAAGLPTLDGFGPIGRGAHALHEEIRVDSLASRAALLAAVLSSG